MNLAEKMAKVTARAKKVFGEGTYRSAFDFIDVYQMVSIENPVPFIVFGSAEKETSAGFFPYCLHTVPKTLDSDPEVPAENFEILCNRREIPTKSFDKNKNACAVCDLVDAVLDSSFMEEEGVLVDEDDLPFSLEETEAVSDREQAVNQIVLGMNSFHCVKPMMSIIAMGTKQVIKVNKNGEDKNHVNLVYTPGKVSGFQVGLAPWNSRNNKKDGRNIHILSTLHQFRLNDKSFFSLDDSDEDFEFKWLSLQPRGKKGWELVRLDSEDVPAVDRLDILDLAKKAPNFFEWRTKNRPEKNQNSALFTYEEQVKMLKNTDCCRQIGAFREFTVERGQANYPPVKAIIDSSRSQNASS